MKNAVVLALVAALATPLDASAAAKQRRADRRNELVAQLHAHRGNVSARRAGLHDDEHGEW